MANRRKSVSARPIRSGKSAKAGLIDSKKIYSKKRNRPSFSIVSTALEKAQRSIEKKPPQEYKPLLLLKDTELDTGLRPVASYSCIPVSVWIETYAVDGGPGSPVAQPQAGIPYKIVARISNLGLAPSYSTFVEFYWINPSPSAADGGSLVMIGSPVCTSINGGASVDIKSNQWIPTYVNDGHECILVRAYDPLLDVIDPASFNPTTDRHVAQRNLQVIQAPVGTHAYSLMHIWPSSEQSRNIELHVNEMEKSLLQRLHTQMHLNGSIGPGKIVYFGTLSRDSAQQYFGLVRNDLSTINFHLSAFDVETEGKEKHASPLPKTIDTQLMRFIDSKAIFKKFTSRKRREKTFFVAGIPQTAKKGELYGFVLSQFEDGRLVGKINYIVSVTDNADLTLGNPNDE